MLRIDDVVCAETNRNWECYDRKKAIDRSIRVQANDAAGRDRIKGIEIAADEQFAVKLARDGVDGERGRAGSAAGTP